MGIIGMQDVETAMQFNMIGLSMTKKFRTYNSSETIFICHGPGLTWVRPLEELIPPMRDAIADGMRAGDPEFAMWNLLTSSILFPYSTGKPIASLLKECPNALIQCEDTAQSLHTIVLLIMWQLFRNLSAASYCNPSELKGDLFSAENDTETNPVHLSFVHFATGELLLFNADYEVAAKRALEVGEIYDKELLPNSVMNLIETFHRAVPVYAAARHTK